MALRTSHNLNSLRVLRSFEQAENMRMTRIGRTPANRRDESRREGIVIMANPGKQWQNCSNLEDNAILAGTVVFTAPTD